MIFKPSPVTEQQQIKLFAGKEELKTPFSNAFIRLNPSDGTSTLASAALSPGTADAKTFARASAVFAEQVPKSFGLDLADLSRESWSLVPAIGDFLAEVETRRFGTLTYTQSANDPEDITVFDRSKRRNISVYASKARVAAQGATFDEDASTEYRRGGRAGGYDVLAGSALAGRADEASPEDPLVRADGADAAARRDPGRAIGRQRGLRAAARAPRAGAEQHRRQSARACSSRCRAHANGYVRGPAGAAGRGSRKRHGARPGVHGNTAVTEPEPSYIYSNRSYWYAQAPVTDYSTATIRFTVPPAFTTACSGEPAQGSPVMLRPTGADGDSRKLHVFATTRPVRYLACVISRFTAMEPPASANASSDQSDRPVSLRLLSTARQRGRAREALTKAAEIIDFYTSVMGEAPYQSLTLAVVEANIPGDTRPAISSSSISRCRRRPSCGATIQQRSTTSPTSSSRTSSPTSGGARRLAGRTITSSG